MKKTQAAGKYFLHNFLEYSQISVVFYCRVIHSLRRLLYLLYDIEVMWRKRIKHTFSVFYTLVKHGFLTNQSKCCVLFILYVYCFNFFLFVLLTFSEREETAKFFVLQFKN